MATIFQEYKKSNQDQNSVWNHFLRSPNGKEAQCKICKKILKSSGSTSPLHNHLKLIHKIDIKQQSQQIKDNLSTSATTTSTTQAQPSTSTSSTTDIVPTATCETIKEPPKKKIKVTDYFKSDHSIEVVVSKLAAQDGFAFSVFCTSNTLRMLFTKSGINNLPKSPHTIKKMIITHSEQLKSTLRNELNNLKSELLKTTASLDEWTSAENVRYMNVNIHSSKLKHKCYRNLGLQRIKGKGTAENCHNILQEKIALYGLTLENIICLVTDGASVMCALGRKTPAFHQLCYAHGIQCAVLDVLYKKNTSQIEINYPEDPRDTDTDTVESENDDIEDEVENEDGFTVLQTQTGSPYLNLQDSYKNVIKKVRTVTKMFKKSPTKAELLMDYDAKEENRGLRLILDCKTRWSSLADMITRFLLLKNSVMKALIDLKSNITFNEKEIQQLQEISDSLNIIKGTVEALCSEDANLLTAEIALKFMIEKLSMIDRQIAMDLVEALKERISQRRMPVLTGTLKYLHNSNNFYKEISSAFPFQNPTNESIKDLIMKINLMSFNQQETEMAESTQQALESESFPVPPVPGTFKEQLQTEIKRTLSAGANDKPIFNDGASSSSGLDLETQINVEMALFDGGGKRADNLQRAYNALLTIVPTSVEAERVFSATGYLCNHLRTSLKDDSIDALSFLRSYYQGEK